MGSVTVVRRVQDLSNSVFIHLVNTVGERDCQLSMAATFNVLFPVSSQIFVCSNAHLPGSKVGIGGGDKTYDVPPSSKVKGMYSPCPPSELRPWMRWRDGVKRMDTERLTRRVHVCEWGRGEVR